MTLLIVLGIVGMIWWAAAELPPLIEAQFAMAMQHGDGVAAAIGVVSNYVT